MTPERCPWCGTDPLYVAYHDTEWGVPQRDARALFEMPVAGGAPVPSGEARVLNWSGQAAGGTLALGWPTLSPWATMAVAVPLTLPATWQLHREKKTGNVHYALWHRQA